MSELEIVDFDGRFGRVELKCVPSLSFLGLFIHVEGTLYSFPKE